MPSIAALLIAALTQALMASAAKLLTPAALQALLEKIIISGLTHAVKLTKNTVDDALVEEVRARLQAHA